MSFNDAIEVDFDLDALNYMIGIVNNTNIDSNNFYDSVNNVFLIDSVDINANQLNFIMNNEVSNIRNIGKISTLYSDFSRYVSVYFGNLAGLFTNVKDFNPNDGIFDANELIRLSTYSLSGSIQLNNITELLTYALENNPFGNRNLLSSLFDGFYDGDLIFIPNGLEITLNIPIDTTQSSTMHRSLFGPTTYLSETTVPSTLEHITEFSNSKITRIVSVPLLLRLTKSKINTINTAKLEKSFVASNTDVILNTSLNTIATFVSVDSALKEALTSALTYVTGNLNVTKKIFNSVNASTLKNNTVGVFQTALDVVRASEMEYNINKKIAETNTSYSSTINLLNSAAKLTLSSKYQLDILAHNIGTDKMIINSSTRDEPDVIADMNLIAQTFIDIENSAAIAFSTSHAILLLVSNTIIKDLVVKNDAITIDTLSTDLTNILNNLNSLNSNALIDANTFINPIYPGVYSSGAAVALTGTITFDGQSNSTSLFVVRVGGALSVAANVKVVLINGALASNIFWVSVGAMALGANTQFSGTVICKAAFAIGTNCKISGRIFSYAAVSINNSIILSPTNESPINLYGLTQFTLYAVGALSNVNGGPCISMGNIASEATITFATPVTSPFIIVGNIYCASPNNTGATKSLEGTIYDKNNLYLKYGILTDLITPNITGNFYLINEPLGLIIDESGRISIISNISVGVYEFYVLYYSNNISSIMILVLSIIPNIIVSDITSSIDSIISLEDNAVVTSEAILNRIISHQLDLSNVVTPQVNMSLDTSAINVANFDSTLFLQNANKIMDNYLQKNNNYSFVALDLDYFRAYGYLISLNPTVNINATTFKNIMFPGVYTSGAAVALTGTIIFDGQSNTNSLFVIRVGAALSVAANVKLVLTNGALASNIFWVVTGAMALGVNTQFSGSIFCNAALAVGTNCIVNGRLFSFAAISINNSMIISPTTVSSVNLNRLSQFSLYAGGAVSNVNGGPCIVKGSIGSGGNVTFATPTTSPCTVIGSIYCDAPDDTGASISIQGYLYPKNTMMINYGKIGDTITPINSYVNGSFSLINEPLGLIIDPLSGIISVKSIIDIGIKEFYISYYNVNDNSSIISIIVLSII
jgi:hypothetical protein